MKIENQISNYGTGNSINNLIIAHETANDKSTLDNEVKHMKGNWTAAFVTHFVGNGGRIIQTAPTGKISWGAGRYANPYSFAQVELCRTKDEATFLKDYAAYIWLLRDLAKQGGIPQLADEGSSVIKKGIKTHRWVSENLGGTDHTDPYGYLASWGISKEQFKLDIKNGLGSVAPTPSYPTLTGSYTVKKGDTLWGIANTHKSTIESIKSLNGLKSNIIIPGQVLKLSGSVTVTKPSLKSSSVIAKEVIDGKWGSGENRKNRLTAAGYNYTDIQNKVNDLLKPKVSKSNATIAKEVIDGKFGNGTVRKRNIESAGYNYNAVQAEVNKLLGMSNRKSDNVIANEVIAGKWGNGQARNDKLKQAGYNVNEIQRLVNQKFR